MRGTVPYDRCSMQRDGTRLFVGEGFLCIMAAHICHADGPSTISMKTAQCTGIIVEWRYKPVEHRASARFLS